MSTHRRRTSTAALGAVALGVGLLAPAAATGASPRSAAPPSNAVQAVAPARLPYQNPSLPVSRRVSDLLSRMTLAEKIGQMTQAERADATSDPTLVQTLKLGSLLSGGGSVPTPNTPKAWADMVDAYQSQALKTRLAIPLLYGVDSVHGHGNLYGATVFPHNIGLGATRDPQLVKRIGRITAQETRATGPQWAFAPCICAARDDRWGRTYESFSESPALFKKLETVIDGLQGTRTSQLAKANHVLATAKHFAGDGLTTYGTSSGDYKIDQGIDQVDRPTFRRLALSPYVPAIRRHHVGSVMPSFSSVDWTEDGLGNPVKMHANRQLITGWLKNQQNFRGLVISDWQAIHQLPGSYADQVRVSVNAGVDMFMEPGYAAAFVSALTAEVDAGRVPMSRINDAVRRILRVKFQLGLFEHPYTNRKHIDDIGSAAHRKVARKAVAESQVLLKNRAGTLPLATNRPVYVAGSNANNIGNQAGGWTLTWQGGSTNVIPGQTILQGIRGASNRTVTYSEDASRAVPARADGVVVVGETPYAEGFGDVGGPQWAYDPGDNNTPRPPQTMKLSDADKAAIRTVCRQAASCTVVVVSGRPMILGKALRSHIDSLVASWLPGSEGNGVADVLFGRKPFTGKLAFSWPRSLGQEPINVGDANYNPLYPFGYGLTTR